MLLAPAVEGWLTDWNVLSCPCTQGVHLYDALTCAPTAVFSHHTPVLDATFQDDGTVLSAGLDGMIKQ